MVSDYFDWHSLSCQFTLSHSELFMKTALNRLRFMEPMLPIVQLLLAMHHTQTCLLLPGNLTSSVQILPLERHNKAPFCSLSFLITVLYKMLYWTTSKIGFHEIIKLCFEFQYPCQRSRMWRLVKKKNVHKGSWWTGGYYWTLLCTGLIMGPPWESDRRLQFVSELCQTSYWISVLRLCGQHLQLKWVWLIDVSVANNCCAL